MGAEYFEETYSGSSAEKAFKAAVKFARHQFGHAGYTGTIAEKDEFQMAEYASADHPDFQDKWGPAGCVQDGPDEFTFFGWASS